MELFYFVTSAEGGEGINHGLVTADPQGPEAGARCG